MDALFGVFSDVMLWGAVPLFGGLGYWEEHLVLSPTNRILMQILLLVVVIAWAGFWYSTGENYRLVHRAISNPKFSFGSNRIENLDIAMDDPSLKENLIETRIANIEEMDEVKVRNYVSNY
jgi:hypothetical protein